MLVTQLHSLDLTCYTKRPHLWKSTVLSSNLIPRVLSPSSLRKGCGIQVEFNLLLAVLQSNLNAVKKNSGLQNDTRIGNHNNKVLLNREV